MRKKRSRLASSCILVFCLLLLFDLGDCSRRLGTGAQPAEKVGCRGVGYKSELVVSSATMSMCFEPVSPRDDSLVLVKCPAPLGPHYGVINPGAQPFAAGAHHGHLGPCPNPGIGCRYNAHVLIGEVGGHLFWVWPEAEEKEPGTLTFLRPAGGGRQLAATGGAIHALLQRPVGGAQSMGGSCNSAAGRNPNGCLLKIKD